MKLPLLLETKAVKNKRGPEVFLTKGSWKLESNTKRFVIALKSPNSEGDEESILGGELLNLDESSIVQAVITDVDVERITIFAIKQ